MYRPEAYTSDATAEAPSIPEQELYKEVTTHTIFMNLPGLDRVHNYPGFFVCPYTPEDPKHFRGIVVFSTNDDGDTWDQRDAATDMPLVATISSTPGNVDPTRFDNQNTITINPLTQNTNLLASISKESALAGKNTAAIGSESGGWELISFANVTNNGDGTYTLFKLLRGRRGTDRNMGVAKSTFVLLHDAECMAFVDIREEDIGTTRKYKPVQIGTPLVNTMPVEWVSYGDTIRPWNPVHIQGTRNSSGDLHITWLRRSRTDESWVEGDVPNHELGEYYEVDIVDGDGNVKRTLSINGENSDQTGVTYTAGQQSFDFGSTQNNVTVKIYQTSEFVGRGFPGTANL